jgi:mannose-6-phosphate isomerase-like protein (cupin superfamily)
MPHTVVNLKQVKDFAPDHGLSPGLESRFARVPLELANSGLSYFRLGPGFRTPFGHTHAEQEEVYVVVDGSARVKLDDEVVELGTWDAVRIPPGVWRGLEGGSEGAQVLAFGAPNTENKDVEMQPGWWSG